MKIMRRYPCRSCDGKWLGVLSSDVAGVAIGGIGLFTFTLTTLALRGRAG